jgi:hypothetical protein
MLRATGGVAALFLAAGCLAQYDVVPTESNIHTIFISALLTFSF